MAEPRPDLALRASDAERERAVELLRRHCSEGRLDVAELDERCSLALGARTQGELEALLADLPPLPAGDEERRPASRERGGTRWSLAVMSGIRRRGRWRPAEHTRALAVMGGANLDLREAELDGAALTITVVAVMGGVEILVPEGTDVELTGFSVMGGRDIRVREAPGPVAPLRLHVRAYTVMGGVDVKSTPRRDRREELARALRRRALDRAARWGERP